MFEFTKSEMRDLSIAFIVLSIAFAISNVGLNFQGFISILPNYDRSRFRIYVS